MSAISAPNLTSAAVNRLLAVKPLWALAKGRARTMMMKRADAIGVPWQASVEQLRSRNTDQPFSPEWQADLDTLTDPTLTYPDYYTTSFHAYDEGNLGWLPAMEVEVAAYAVHARLWPNAGAKGDGMLRQSYHDVLKAQLPSPPKDIVDIGCGIGMSTQALQETFPEARLTGVDLSPYFLAVAQYRQNAQANPAPSLPTPPSPITWHHAAAEATGLPAASYDLVSACLLFHELPQSASRAIIQEARRLLRPGGHMTIMDMNPQSEIYSTMPPFVLTLLKSTEPYLDEYFALDLTDAFQAAGFDAPSITCNSPRHRTIIARAA